MTPKEVLDHVSGIGYACDQTCISGCGCMAEGLKMILDLIAGETERCAKIVESHFQIPSGYPAPVVLDLDTTNQKVKDLFQMCADKVREPRH